MNQLQVFNNPEFGDVEVILVEGRPYMAATAAAKILGYQNPEQAIRVHCKGVRKISTPSNGGAQRKNFIPEGDLYRLIVGSTLPAAEKFERWVFDDVLPSIRAHGAYMTPAKIEEALLDPDTIIQLATALKEERNKSQFLAQENNAQRQIIGELQPKADYVDYILSSTGTMATTQIAADYAMSAKRLNKILAEERIQRKVGDQWILYSEHMGQGYTKSETIPIVHTDGRPDTKLFTRWTQKGRLKINEILNRRGIYANLDIIKSA